MKTFLHPLSFGVTFITFGIVLLTLSELVIDKPMFSYPLLGFTGILSIAFGLVFFGGRALRFYGFIKLRLILPVLGVLLFIAASWGGFVGHQSIKSLLDLGIPSEKLEKVISDEATTAERKALISKIYASMYYIEYGELIEYYLKDGSKELYAPTEVDIRAIKEKRVMMKIQDSFLIFAYVCIVSLILSLLSAFLSPIKKKLD